MCIRDRCVILDVTGVKALDNKSAEYLIKLTNAASLLGAHCCLLYTSDAADERSSVDLGGRRIIKKKNCRDYCGRESKRVAEGNDVEIIARQKSNKKKQG